MPQIFLECSHNIIETNLTPFFHELHHILSEHLPTELRNCKSRLIKHDNFVVGEGASHNGFVHLSISVLKGRSKPLLDSIATMIMEKLKITFSRSLQALSLEITVAISELPDVYVKFASSHGAN